VKDLIGGSEERAIFQPAASTWLMTRSDIKVLRATWPEKIVMKFW
jgi:hypothetical protein